MPIPYYIAQRRGTRPAQEDTWCVASLPGWFIGAVFDGHGGGRAARAAATAFPQKVVEKLRTLPPNDTLKQCVEAISAEIEPLTDDGATVLALAIGQGAMAWANAGDGRLLLVAAKGYRQLTTDHRLDNPRERERIEKIGQATIRFPYLYVGSYGLMVTRSIGDRLFKPAGVTATPETGQRLRDENDRWLIAATDGLWDVLGNERAAEICSWHTTPRAISEALADAATASGGTDNVTVLAVKLQPQPRR